MPLLARNWGLSSPGAMNCPQSLFQSSVNSENTVQGLVPFIVCTDPQYIMCTSVKASTPVVHVYVIVLVWSQDSVYTCRPAAPNLSVRESLYASATVTVPGSSQDRLCTCQRLQELLCSVHKLLSCYCHCTLSCVASIPLVVATVIIANSVCWYKPIPELI